MPKSKVAEEIFALLFKIMVHNNGAIYFIQCSGCNLRRVPVGKAKSGEVCEKCLKGLLSFVDREEGIEIYEYRAAANRLEELGLLIPTLAPEYFPRYKQGSKIIWMEESLNKARQRRQKLRREIMKVGDHICVQLPGQSDYSYCRVTGLTKTHIALNVCGVVKDYLRSTIKIAIPLKQDNDFKLEQDL